MRLAKDAKNTNKTQDDRKGMERNNASDFQDSSKARGAFATAKRQMIFFLHATDLHVEL